MKGTPQQHAHSARPPSTRVLSQRAAAVFHHCALRRRAHESRRITARSVRPKRQTGGKQARSLRTCAAGHATAVALNSAPDSVLPDCNVARRPLGSDLHALCDFRIVVECADQRFCTASGQGEGRVLGPTDPAGDRPGRREVFASGGLGRVLS